MEKKYTASLSQSQGRVGWSVIFRHPVRSENGTDTPGIRVRRGLATRDREEAERLCQQMNEMLSDPLYWSPTARGEAERRYDRRVVDIFYYKMMPEELDYAKVRDSVIPLPRSEDSAYRTVLLLGTTGGGKTTLVRQLIGTDPNQERFPSTSTAKTTVHDIEVVLDESPYRAVVTFFSNDEVREYLNECISAAVLAAYRGAANTEILRRLLNHVDQRFRFNYVLGNGLSFASAEFEGDDEEDEEFVEPELLSDFPTVDLKSTNEMLSSVVSELRDIAKRHGDGVRVELAAKDEKDERVIDEIFEEELDNLLRDDEAFHAIADRIMDEIESRFNLLTTGEIRRTKQGWPLLWHWETSDRQAFIKTLSRFSSNYAPLFGSLLTPLVNGLRVAGPFLPSWINGSQPKLVILDGEGLGHTPQSSAAISTSVSRRIEQADAVLLVDNATQPMQAAQVAAMRELVSTGNASKLLFVFTHFEQVRGDNLPTTTAKMAHVLGSAENVLASIGEELGPFAERLLRQRLEKGCSFLGHLHEVLEPNTKAKKPTIIRLQSLVDAINNIIDRPELVEARPEYDKMNLVLAVKSAAESFLGHWLARLGLDFKPDISKEHWTRIKALSRRLATPGWADEYDNLKPVADLKNDLQKRIFVFVQNPMRWTGPEPADDGKQEIYNRITENVGRRILDLAGRRIRIERMKEWQEAYAKRGMGSTYLRANVIAEQVYNRAAPVPDITPSPDRNQFLREVVSEVEQAAEEVGAHLL